VIDCLHAKREGYVAVARDLRPEAARVPGEGSHHRLIEAEVIDPTRMPAAQRAAVFRRLYRVHQQIFAGVPIESFVTYLVRPDALRTRIQVYRNEAGGIVGYCAVHLFERDVDGRTVGVVRAEAGLLPGYRGTSATLWFGGAEALRYKGLHPLRMTVLFATPVHPSSYHMLSKYLWRSYPHPARKTPAWVEQLLEKLADSSGSPRADPADPLLRDVGWITRETAADRDSWRVRPEPDVQYYLARNPGYVHGTGLAMIAPLSPGNLLMSAAQYLSHLVVRGFRRLWRRIGRGELWRG
jgi:hypothetical protein